MNTSEFNTQEVASRARSDIDIYGCLAGNNAQPLGGKCCTPNSAGNDCTYCIDAIDFGD